MNASHEIRGNSSEIGGASKARPEAVWSAIKKDFDLPTRTVDHLEETKDWRVIVSELLKANSQAGTVLRIFQAIKEMPISLVRTLSTQKSWSDFVEVFIRGLTADEAGSQDLYFQTQNGPALMLRMLSSVHQASAAEKALGNERDLIGLLKTYRGAPAHLEQFINAIGAEQPTHRRDNPYLLAAEAQVLFPGARSTIGEQRFSAHSDDSNSSRRGTPQRTESMAALDTQGNAINSIYRAYHPNSPHMCFVSSLEALLKILSAFNPESYSTEKCKTRKQTKEQKDKAYFLELSLHELLAEPDTHQARQDSRIIARYLDVVQDLGAHIEALRGEVNQLDKERFRGFSSAFSRIKSYSGGRIWAYFEENREKLPANILKAYEILSSPLSDLSDEEAHVFRKGLVAYYLREVCRVRQDVFADLREDLAAYSVTQKNRPEFLKETGIDNVDTSVAEAKVSHILNADRAELSLGEVAEVENAFDFLRSYRAAINKETWNRFSRDISSALAFARELYMTQGDSGSEPRYDWQPDSLQESVPLKRLQATRLELLAVGRSSPVSPYEKEIFPNKKRVTAMSRDDFAALQRLLQMKVAAANDERIITQCPVTSFQETIQGAVVALRKARSFSEQLSASGLTDSQVRTGLAQEKLKFCPLVFTKNGYFPKEVFAQEHGTELAQVLECVEVNAKERNWGMLNLRWKNFLRNHLSRIQAQDKAGIYEVHEAAKEFAETAKKYTLRGALAEELLASEKFLAMAKDANSYAGLSFNISLPSLRRSYFDQEEVRVLKTLKRGYETINAIDPAKMKDAFDIDQAWLTRKVLESSSTANGLWIDRKVVGERLRSIGCVPTYGPTRQTVYAEGGHSVSVFSHISPELAQTWLKEMEAKYISSMEVPATFFQRLSKLDSDAGRNSLNRARQSLVPWLRMEQISKLSPSPDLYIERKFMDLVIKLPKFQKTLS